MSEFSVVSVATGKQVSLVSLWEKRRCVVFFLRHLGCRHCKFQAAQFEAIRKKLEKQSVSLVAVSLGQLTDAPKWLQETGFQGEFFLDTTTHGDMSEFTALEQQKPSRAYGAMRLKRGRQFVVNEQSRLAAQKITEFGDTFETRDDIIIYPGDVLQLGAVFVMGSGNLCDYAFRSSFAGDGPAVDEVFAAATGQTATGLDFVYQGTKAWVKSLAVASRIDNGSAKSWWTCQTDTAQTQDKSFAAVSDAVTLVVALLVMNLPRPSLLHEQFRAFSLVDIPLLLVPVGKFIALLVCIHAARRLGFFSALFKGTSRAMHFWTTFALCLPFSIGTMGLPEEWPPTWFDGLLLLVFFSARPLVLALLAVLAFGPQSATVSPPQSETSPENAVPAASLLTPAQIDEKVFDAGFVDCDCNTVMASIKMQDSTNQDDQRGVQSDDNKSVGRVRSATWDASSHGEFGNEYQQTLCYARSFLAKPHPLVGRSGPVCPFVPTALKRNTLFVSVVRTGRTGAHRQQQLIDLIKGFLPEFLAMEPTEAKLLRWKAVILTFPDVSVEDAPQLIDAVQLKCKPFFVRKGLMLGEFHKANNTPGLHNSTFFPLRTPFPSLAIRYMVPGDLQFLDVASYEVSVRVDFLESFLKTFGADSVDAKVPKKTRAAIDEAKQALVRAQRELHDKET